MSHTPSRFLGILSLAVVLTALIISQPTSPTLSTLQPEKRSSANDDPRGRKAWELKRQRDPATGIIPHGIRRAELAFSRSIPKAPASRDIGFSSRGPFNVGGRTRAFAMDVNDPDILIAGSVSGSIYRSTDGGQSWTPSEVPTIVQGITCIAQDTRAGHTNVWYAGSGEVYGQSASGTGAYYSGNGLYKSTDGGITWDTITGLTSNTPTSFDHAFDYMWQIMIDPSRLDSSIVYAATYGGLYRSNNEGVTWKRVLGSFGSNDPLFVSVDVTATGIVYAALTYENNPTNEGCWRSSDGGLTYSNIDPPFFPDSCNRIVMSHAPSDENQVYFLANTPNHGQANTNYQGDVEWNSFWKYTYLSGDGSGSGGAWEDRSTNLPSTGGPFDKFMTQGSYDMIVIVKPDDPNYIILGGTNLYRSTDAFVTNDNWRMIGGYKEGTMLHIVEGWDNHHPDQHGALFHPSNYNVLYSANDGGVFRTDNVNANIVSWVSLNNGYLTTQFYTLAVDNASPGDPIVIGGLQDNGTWFTNSTSPTHTWLHTRGGDGSFCAIADNKTAYYYSIQLGKMQRAYVDANGNTTSYARIDPRDGRGYQFINPYILDPVDNNIMYLPAGHKMWRNDNLAGIPMINNWDSITTNWMTFPDTCTTVQGEITAVACSVNPAHTLYYGTDKRRVYKVTNANTGSSTRQEITGLTSPAIFPMANVNCIAVDRTDANHAVVVFSNYGVMSLFSTTDGGQSWSKVGGNLEEFSTGAGAGPSCRWLSIMNLPDGKLYLLATSTGLYATDSLLGPNTVWFKQGANTIGNTVCEMVITRDSDGLVVVGTHGNGVFTSNITSVSQAVGTATVSPHVYDLELFPNPSFSVAPQLTFTTGSSAPIRIDVVDVSGRIQKSYENVASQIGANVFALTGTAHLPRGVYVVRVEQNKRSAAIKWLRQ